MKAVFAFGQPVPEEFLAGLLADGWSEDELTGENIETLNYYDYENEN